MNWWQTHIEQNDDGLFSLVWPDGSNAWTQKYKTYGWAIRTQNWLLRK